MNTHIEETVSAALDSELDSIELARELDELTRFEACEAMRRQAALRALLHGRQPSRSLRESLRDQIAAEPPLQAPVAATPVAATVVSLFSRARAWVREPRIPQTVPSWAFAASVAALAVVATTGGFGGSGGTAPVAESARTLRTATEAGGGVVAPAAQPQALSVSAVAPAVPAAPGAVREQRIEQWDQYLSQHRQAVGGITEEADPAPRAPTSAGLEGPL